MGTISANPLHMMRRTSTPDSTHLSVCIRPPSSLVRILVLVLVGSALLSGGVLAHPPTDVVVTYDQNSGDLIAAFSHNVDDPTTHYVKKVIVTQGGTVLIEKSYTSQPDPVSFTYHYSLPQLDQTKGDVVVNAQCSMFGSRSGTLTPVTASGSGAAGTTIPAAPTPAKSPLDSCIVLASIGFVARWILK